MLVKEHRGSLNESMKTVVEIEPTIEAITAWVNSITVMASEKGITKDQITVVPYGPDDRIGWDCHLISVRGQGVYGMCNGPVEMSPKWVKEDISEYPPGPFERGTTA